MLAKGDHWRIFLKCSGCGVSAAYSDVLNDMIEDERILTRPYDPEKDGAPSYYGAQFERGHFIHRCSDLSFGWVRFERIARKEFPAARDTTLQFFEAAIKETVELRLNAVWSDVKPPYVELVAWREENPIPGYTEDLKERG